MVHGLGDVKVVDRSLSMAIKSETRLGSYEIVSPIGAGGIGEVYRARDPRLKREVAIKVLPASFSSDPQRLHRFEQEATTGDKVCNWDNANKYSVYVPVLKHAELIDRYRPRMALAAAYDLRCNRDWKS